MNAITNLLAYALYILLRFMRWKKHIVFKNFEFMQQAFCNAPFKNKSFNLFYLSLLKNIAQDSIAFLLHNTSFKKLPKELEKYPYIHKKTKFYISNESIENIKHMQKGGIFLAAHYGNYEAIGAWLSVLNVPLKASYAKIKPNFLNVWLENSLRSVNGIPYSMFVKNPKDLLNMLDKGTLFCLVADQDFRHKSAIESTFLGQNVKCNALLHFLLKHRPFTPVYFCSLIKNTQNTELYVKKLKSTSETDTQKVYAAYHKELEKLLYKDPTRWYGFTHRRFKSTNTNLYD